MDARRLSAIDTARTGTRHTPRLRGPICPTGATQGTSVPRFSRRGEQAIQSFQEADNLDAMPRLAHGDDVVYGMEAAKARGRGEVLLEPTAPVVVGAGEAISWDNQPDEIFKGA